MSANESAGAGMARGAKAMPSVDRQMDTAGARRGRIHAASSQCVDLNTKGSALSQVA
ncbi:MAG: hypothetical protein ACRDHE_14560 [Ktedonobacterales bacterium]